MKFPLIVALLLISAFTFADPRPFEAMDLFNMEYAVDPQISPDGRSIVYVRRGFDVMKDSARTSLWIIDVKSGAQQPLVNVDKGVSYPRWSPNGRRLAYIADGQHGRQIYMHWMNTGNTVAITQLTASPGNLSWSPDGKYLAYSSFVTSEAPKLGKLPTAPEGAEWAKDARIIDQLLYRSDSGGFSKTGASQLFIISSEGGSPRQLTETYPHTSRPTWSSDGKSLYFTSNYDDDWQRDVQNSEIYKLDIATKEVTALTSRDGPDFSPEENPAGDKLLFIGSDNVGGYQVNQLYVTDVHDISPRSLTESLDRSINSATWSSNGNYIYFNYVDKSVMKIGRVDLKGNIEEIASGLGGTAIGRPYTSGGYSLADTNRVAFVSGSTNSPAEVAIIDRKKTRYLTRLNDNLLKTVEMGDVEEIWYSSSADGRVIHGWIVKPPGFDKNKKYPLILEIHGGPNTSYAAEFSAEIQLYSAAGYVVLYANPRGSTSYGTKFTREIYQAYPSQDYDDLMSGVDEVISRGYVDTDNLFVTGGSGGGVLTAWIVGKTDRFRAAVVAKPVINWYAFTLTSDIGSFFWKINFDKMPWEDPMAYHKLSPISLVGNVSTPTMLLTGEVDYRTPMSESEQYYQALKIRGIDSMLVRIPGASHSITRRPSNLLRKVAYILGWFDKYREGEDKPE